SSASAASASRGTDVNDSPPATSAALWQSMQYLSIVAHTCSASRPESRPSSATEPAIAAAVAAATPTGRVSNLVIGARLPDPHGLRRHQLFAQRERLRLS